MGVSESTSKRHDSNGAVRLPSEDTVRLVYSSRIYSSRIVGRAALATTTPALLRRRQLNHDIRHELATIMLLASLLDTAPDVGVASRLRARQLLGEARWLDQLHRAYDDTLSGHDGSPRPTPELIQLDLFAGEVVAAIGLSTSTTLRFTGDVAWAYADRLAYWRALRNMIGNAVRAAGPGGRVDVRVERVAGWAVAQVDDDGPGFGALPPGPASSGSTESLGLDIVRDFAITWNGDLAINRGALGGCCVRLRMRAVEPGMGPAGADPVRGGMT